MEEPNPLIRWTLFVIAGGDAGIIGGFTIGLVVILCLIPGRTKPIPPLFLRPAVALSLILAICAPPPFPIWFMALTVLWLFCVMIRLNWKRSFGATGDLPISSTVSMSSRLWFLSPFIWLLTAFNLEIPYVIWQAPSAPIPRILVIGDSVTAGLLDGEDTWPMQLARVSEVEVWDASQPGATLRSACEQNDLLSGSTGLLILEIGGNDLLGGLSLSQFDEHLDRLLTEVTKPGRMVVMFELPLPPLCTAHGIIQRGLAVRHGVKLIPKRNFAQLLTTGGATVDGIHLSKQGQTQLMELVQELFRNQLKPGVGTYQQLERRAIR